MSAERIAELARALQDAGERLSDPSLAPEAAATLIDESAGLAAEAAGELERAARAAGAGADPAHPGQAELL